MGGGEGGILCGLMGAEVCWGREEEGGQREKGNGKAGKRGWGKREGERGKKKEKSTTRPPPPPNAPRCEQTPEHIITIRTYKIKTPRKRTKKKGKDSKKH